MRTSIATFVVALLALSITATTVQANDDLTPPKPVKQMTAQDWSNYGDRIVDALQSGDEVVLQSALRMSIQYADVVDVRPAIVDVMAVYRNHEDARIRRLAVLTLGSMDSRLARNYLRLSADYESTPCVRKTIKAVLAQPVS